MVIINLRPPQTQKFLMENKFWLWEIKKELSPIHDEELLKNLSSTKGNKIRPLPFLGLTFLEIYKSGYYIMIIRNRASNLQNQKSPRTRLPSVKFTRLSTNFFDYLL